MSKERDCLRRHTVLPVSVVPLALLAAFAVGCSDDPAPTRPDTGIALDVPRDASPDPGDVSRPEEGEDVSRSEVDEDVARPDGSEDVATDTSEDVATDTSEDVATDASEDVATDVAPDTMPGRMIRVRVAHLAPDAPAVDVCLRPVGATSWSGVRPTLASLGAAAGLAYAQVTRYLELNAGAYEVRIVAPGSSSCDTALAGLPDTALPALPDGARATIAAVGLLSGMGPTAFRLQPYVDEAPAEMGQLKIRFVHASPGTPAVDVGIPGMGTTFTSVFSNVAFPNAATPYFASMSPFAATLAVRAAGTPTPPDRYPLTLPNISLPLGSTSTIFAIGRSGSASTPLGALICNDVTPLSNNLSICALLPSRGPLAYVRVAHLSPDAPPVDFCLRREGTSGLRDRCCDRWELRRAWPSNR